MKFKIKHSKLYILIFSFALCAMRFTLSCYAQDQEAKKPEGIIINGDRVEFITESKDFTATGNVEVVYKDTKLTCDKMTINTETKDAEAEGNARIEDKTGVIEGTKLIYNFNTKIGTIIDANFRSNPYFGKSEKLDKVSDEEFISHRGYMTTCSYDNPHYLIKMRRANFFPGDKVQTKDDIFYIRGIPVAYTPHFNRSLRDPLMHVQLMPGNSKDWGYYMLSAWRYNLTEDISGRIYADYREKWGNAQGLGVNYKSLDLGRGDFKFYYSHQVDREHLFDGQKPLGKYQRYLIRLRHSLQAERDNVMMEYNKIEDSKRALLGPEQNFLKDYFFREYEKDAQPLSYISVHHAFDYSSLDLLMQKRVNRWYTQDEMLPQIKYNLPNIKIGQTPFYVEHTSGYVNYNHKNAVPSPSWSDTTYNKFDTTDKLSLPTKIAFFNLTPFVSGAGTYYDKNGLYGSTWQLSASTGSDLSTKFYRIFNFQTNALGLDINDFRHIITPTLSYSYNLSATTPPDIRISRSTTTSNSTVGLSLSNKLQTKRKDKKVDLLNLRANTAYNLKQKTGPQKGGNFTDYLFALDLTPYSWMSFYGDATFQRSGDHSDTNWNTFSKFDYDLSFNLGKDRTIGIGQRYFRKSSNELTYSLVWRLNPKWLFSIYQRRTVGNASKASVKGLIEQEYRISRDLHCWTMDFTYNVKRGFGEGVYLIFRLKAFPELEFEYNQEYHKRKPGSQANQ